MKLKPCPFCESECQWLEYGGGGRHTYVYCVECCGRGGCGQGEDGAAQVWNTRPLSERERDLVEMVPKLIHELKHYVECYIVGCLMNGEIADTVRVYGVIRDAKVALAFYQEIADGNWKEEE